MTTPQDLSNEILTEIELEKVKKIAEDELAFHALKKYILAVALRHGVMEKGRDFKSNVNWALQLSWGATDAQGMPRTDEELGQNLRALTTAVKLVESGFKELEEMKELEKEVEEEDNVNEGE